MLRWQMLDEGQKDDFIISALEGDARREVLLLASTARATSIEGLTESLWRVAVAKLRALFCCS